LPDRVLEHCLKLERKLIVVVEQVGGVHVMDGEGEERFIEAATSIPLTVFRFQR